MESLLQAQCKNCTVVPMNDGEMGGLLFSSNQAGNRLFGAKIAEAEYIDADGVIVLIALNVDNHGMLYELDFWKVDFSKLQRYPNARDLVNIKQYSD